MSESGVSFVDAVAREFEPLCAEYGFREVRRSDHMVEFQSDRVVMAVHHSRYDEVELRIGRTGKPEDALAFGLFDVLRLVAPDAIDEHRMVSATTPEAVGRAASEIVEILRARAHAVLSGDPLTFCELSARRRQSREAYAQSISAARVRRDAEIAFRKQEYDTAAKLYASILHDLTDVERRKLGVARRKAGV